MPKRLFEFSPPVQLILTNLPTVRQIQKVFNEGTIRGEVKQFLTHMKSRLREEIPEVKPWQSDIRNDTLYLWPGQGWHVGKGDHIAVCFYMQQCIEPRFYNNDDDPMVALYVPSAWRHLQSFTNRLKAFRIPTFEHIGDHIDMDNSYPLWSDVHLAPLVKRTRLDLDGLEKAIVDRARKLVAREGTISKFISAVRRKRA